MTEYQIGDPVVDLAQGRPMIVLDVPDLTVAEWNDINSYDLLENYANNKFDVSPEEAVVETAYLSDIRSDPSKSYTCPVSRVALIDAHHADGGRRVFDRVAIEIMAAFLATVDPDGEHHELTWCVERFRAVFDRDTVAAAQELADLKRGTASAPDAEVGE